ncbi:hypothetical protein BG53_12710 [Paenibacillus darwinianus]|uniref:Type II secretion system protein GspF domain-containing protein n=1 Tax=Paenibacillus darwinianus TaxID=1380763 RepID=A0A9W5S2J7_9BACL|nr:type II secretion system F family protein [Paenibacillus darwinianus]EXX86068.1 hypothetical protein CH50_07970 [Paenibacillus darwinianus]EXX86373.1 hypothetical protein BG52_06630 [Paenibacillus darwinianus]EXX90876.1 hypothetical protein BG53_12710 [Paenibacillus darwinianus]
MLNAWTEVWRIADWRVTAAVAALYVLSFVAIERLLRLYGTYGETATRLHYRRREGWRVRLDRLAARFERPYGHLGVLLESIRWQVNPSSFLVLSLMLLITGFAAGALFIQSPKGALLMAALAGGMPYLMLRMVLTQRQLLIRLEFLPAVELFYQCYMISGGKQIRNALQRTVEERRMLGPMQPVFEQLYRNLSVKGDDEASLRIFSAALGHIWGDYFANILRVALAEGCPAADSLKRLIDDMRQAQRANQLERNRLLEIRLANFSPILFLALFLGINFYYNPDNAYAYYVLDPKGRDMLLNALALIFGSFVMGLYLSRKKM